MTSDWGKWVYSRCGTVPSVLRSAPNSPSRNVRQFPRGVLPPDFTYALEEQATTTTAAALPSTHTFTLRKTGETPSLPTYLHPAVVVTYNNPAAPHRRAYHIDHIPRRQPSQIGLSPTQGTQRFTPKSKLHILNQKDSHVPVLVSTHTLRVVEHAQGASIRPTHHKSKQGITPRPPEGRGRRELECQENKEKRGRSPQVGCLVSCLASWLAAYLTRVVYACIPRPAEQARRN